MPEAAIREDGEAHPREDHVRLAAKAQQGTAVLEEPQAGPV